jgi:Mg-chelatase subunit ChlI
MAKALLVLLLIAVAAFFVYRETNIMPSDEVQLVTHLKDRFGIIVNKFTSAAGRSGMVGLDSTFDAEAAVVQIQKIRTELADLRNKLTEDRAIQRARALSEKIEDFCKKNDILRP